MGSQDIGVTTLYSCIILICAYFEEQTSGFMSHERDMGLGI